MREGGGTGYAGSTIFDPDVKPGSTHMSGLRRTFDPLRPTYLRAPASETPARRGPLTLDEEIDRALDATGGVALLDADEEEKLNRILDQMALETS